MRPLRRELEQFARGRQAGAPLARVERLVVDPHQRALRARRSHVEQPLELLQLAALDERADPPLVVGPCRA
ncbi:MAG: hypothetical protein WDO13_20095 [Verrucomicrobiota bacterium]